METDDVRCPVCGGRGVPIVYGYPGVELAEAERRREVVIGGCLPSDDGAGCLQCGAIWEEEVN